MARLSLDGRFAVTLDATLSELTIWDVAAGEPRARSVTSVTLR